MSTKVLIVPYGIEIPRQIYSSDNELDVLIVPYGIEIRERGKFYDLCN